MDLPDDVLLFLLGSRYCDTDRLANLAGSLFNDTPPGWARVQAICDYVHQHIDFNYMENTATWMKMLASTASAWPLTSGST